jgi:hypothetical protein
MNFALGALILLLLIFPGILFRFAYLSGPYSRKNFQTSLSDEFVLSLIPAFLIQTSGYFFIEHVLGLQVNLSLLIRLISGSQSLQNSDFILIGKSLFFFSFYNSVTFLIGFLFGKLFRNLVAKNHWDLKYHSLRFNNEWYYLLSGRLQDFQSKSGESGKANLVGIDVLCESHEGTIIYTGILREFYLSKNDGLDRIYLTDVYRRKLGDDSSKELATPVERELDKRYYKMPGELFVIPYLQIKNMNISYYVIGEEV